jgi:hypothetical protein
VDFEKNINAYIDEISDLTPYTISGNNIESEFSIVINIEMEPFNRYFGRSSEKGEDHIPIIIRSRKDGNHIQDVM